MINKMAYRVSFVLMSSGKIHIAPKDKEKTVCGVSVMECHKIVNLQELRQTVFCKKCHAAYHERDEKDFAVIS
jgi:hypothetical protein